MTLEVTITKDELEAMLRTAGRLGPTDSLSPQGSTVTVAYDGPCPQSGLPELASITIQKAP